jgi:hypothetical protein
MKLTDLFSIVLISILLGACSPKQAADKPHGVLTDAQKQTLDKAKKTEELLDKTNKERMKEVDDATVEK